MCICVYIPFMRVCHSPSRSGHVYYPITLSKSYMDMASKLFTFTFTFTLTL